VLIVSKLVACRNVCNCFDDKACSLKVYEYRFPHIPQKQGLKEHRELLKNIQVHSWIVDTSIEYDQNIIDGILKVYFEGLVVILRNERYLLSWNLLLDENIAQDDLFPDGFNTQSFVKIVENGDIWKMFQQGNMNEKLHIKENSNSQNLQE